MEEGLQGPTPDTHSERYVPRRGLEGASLALTLFEVLSWIPDVVWRSSCYSILQVRKMSLRPGFRSQLCHLRLSSAALSLRS